MAYINGKEILFSPQITMDFTEENEAIRAENKRLTDENNTLRREVVMMSNERDEAVTMLSSIVSGTAENIVIPDGVEIIREYAFYRQTMTSISIPPTVNRIERMAFNACASCSVYDFSGHTAIPTLENTNAFTSIRSDAKIIVPSNLYDEWVVATNWANYSSNIFKAPSPDEIYYLPQTDIINKVSVGETLINGINFMVNDACGITGKYITEMFDDSEYNRTYSLTDTDVNYIVVFDGAWHSDMYDNDGIHMIGTNFSGTMRFLRQGVFCIYATFANIVTGEHETVVEHKTAAYIFEVN